MAEFFVFSAVEAKAPHWSTVPNDLFSLGIPWAAAAAAIAAGIGAGHYDVFDSPPLDDGFVTDAAPPIDADFF